MRTSRSRSSGRAKATVAALLIGAAGAGMAWIGVQLYELRDNATFRVAGACKVCGRVEGVRELERASPAALPLNGDQCESIVMMVAALGGRIANAAHTVTYPTYETQVRFDDGSMRILRETTLPPWKPGDRVRVMRGRVEPMG